jgi:hypothetical protein
VEETWGDLRRRGVQPQTPGAARDDGHLALEGEEGGEVLELGLGHSGQFGAEEGGKGSPVGRSVGFRQGRGGAGESVVFDGRVRGWREWKT